MWLHVSDTERQLSIDKRENNEQTLPDTNDSHIQDNHKRRDDPAPEPPDEDDTPEPGPGPKPRPKHLPNDASAALSDKASPTAPTDDPLTTPTATPTVASIGSKSAAKSKTVPDDVVDGPPLKKVNINTTAFPFWPDPTSTKYSLPIDEESDEAAGETEEDDAKAQRQRSMWLAADIAYPESEGDGKRWHGVHFLVEGWVGRVGMWIRVDGMKLINQVRYNSLQKLAD
jgi:hypothetical protein